MIHPPHIEYETPYVAVKVALPANVNFDGQPLPHPLPQEAEIRSAMIEFSEKIQSLYEGQALVAQSGRATAL